MLRSARTTAARFTTTATAGRRWIPGAYNFAFPPGRVIPSVTASLGYRFGVTVPDSVTMRYRSPSTAMWLSVGATVPLVLIGMYLWGAGRKTDSVYTIGAGLTLGPAAGYVYAGEYGHAAGMSLLRAIAAIVGPIVFIVSSITSDDCNCRPSRPGEVLGASLMIALPLMAGYDIFDAPRAARRANARNGVTSLGIVPTAAVGGPAPNSGLALAGRF